MKGGEHVIVALDSLGRSRSLELARELAGHVWGFKVNDLLLAEGARIVTELKQFGRVFADPKLHDIPNTVGNEVQVLAQAGADLITVHAGGGRDMMREAVAKAGSAQILAVSVLTSFNDQGAQEVFGCEVRGGVRRLVELACRERVHGIVCSPQELDLLREIPVPASCIRVTPGVRPEWYGKKDDQVRTMTPRQAVSAGASLLVIGRPITGDASPRDAAMRIVEELRVDAKSQ